MEMHIYTHIHIHTCCFILVFALAQWTQVFRIKSDVMCSSSEIRIAHTEFYRDGVWVNILHAAKEGDKVVYSL